MAKKDELEKVTFKVLKGKNLTGFVHPKTRRLVTANEKGIFEIDSTDKEAIAILSTAKDVTEI